MSLQQFFYDEQIRRFLLQFTRMFSNFQIESGLDANGSPTLIRVPVRYGDASRNAQSILQNNSINGMPSAPLMTFYISSLDYSRSRVQEPYFVDKKVFRQRTYDPVNDVYETTQGNAFTVERLMPVPYDLSLQLDIWTTNTNQKLQIFEQILTLFNPSLEIQSTDNFIDWTSLSVVELQSVNWSNRSIPAGTDDTIDIGSIKFSLPIWISPPAKVKHLGVVHKIIASIYDANGDANEALLNDDLLLGTRQKITPYGYQVLLVGNQLQLLLANSTVDSVFDGDDVAASTNATWSILTDLYGLKLRDGISQVRLVNPGTGVEVAGYVTANPTDDHFLIFTVNLDSMPGNTLLPVNAIVNPLAKGPAAGLPAAVLGQRYLLVEGTGSTNGSAISWGGLVAQANDIIEFDGTNWFVSFDSTVALDSALDSEFVTNITTEIQYRWDGTQWLKSYEGLYPGGEWSLVI